MNINKLIIFTLIISVSAIISDTQCSEYNLNSNNNRSYAWNKQKNKQNVKNKLHDSSYSSSNKSINSDDNYHLLQDYDDDCTEENYDAPISYGEYYHNHEISNEIAAPIIKDHKNNNHKELSVSAFSVAPLPKNSHHVLKITQVLNDDAAPSIR